MKLLNNKLVLFSIFLIGQFGDSQAQSAIANDQLSWPSFRGGPTNSGRISFELKDTSSSTLTSPQSYKTDGLIWATGVSDKEGNFYVGSADKYLYAFDADKKLKWRYRLLNRADSLIDSASVVTSTGLVVIPGGDGHLHAVDKETGEQRWIFQPTDFSQDQHQQGAIVNSFEGNVTESPEGLICAGSDNSFLYCLNNDGSLAFKFKTGMMIWSLPTFSAKEKWMAFGSLDKSVYLLDSVTGKKLAQFETKGEVKASLHQREEGGRTFVYFGDSQGLFYKLEVLKGKKSRLEFKEVWRKKLDGEIYSSATSSAEEIFVGSLGGSMWSVTPAGKTVWQYRTHAPVSSSPVLSNDGVLIFGAKNGKMYALDIATGSRIWSYRSSSKLYKANLDASPLVLSDRTIVNGSYSGSIHMIPYGYCLANNQDNACEFGGNEDIEDLILKLSDGVHLLLQDSDGNLQTVENTVLSVDRGAPLRLRLVVKKEGKWLSNASFHAWASKVKIAGQDFIYRISTDGESLDIIPNTFFKGTQLRVELKAAYFLKTSFFADMFKLIPSSRQKITLNFKIRQNSDNNFSDQIKAKFASGEQLMGLRSMALLRPASLDTYIPAALDGQFFMVRFLQNSYDNKFDAIVYPAYFDNGSYLVMPEASKSFLFKGTWSGDELVVTADSFKLSAMGATIPFSQAKFNMVLNKKENIDGSFFAETSCLKLRGNGMNYSFSVELIDATCDHQLRLVNLGQFKADVVNQVTTVPSLQWTVERTSNGFNVKVNGQAGPGIVNALAQKSNGEMIKMSSLSWEEETTDGMINLKLTRRDLKSDKDVQIRVFYNGVEL
jgi:outer membrane protein assembly factor BamB